MHSKDDRGGARLRQPSVGPIPFCLGSMANRSEKDDLRARLLNRCLVTFHKINVPLLLFRFPLFSPSFLFLSFPSKTINKGSRKKLDETNRTKEEESIDIFIDEAGIRCGGLVCPVILSLIVKEILLKRGCFESLCCYSFASCFIDNSAGLTLTSRSMSRSDFSP